MSLQQFSASEYCDRMKFEFDYINSQCSMLKIENERLKQEKQELLQQSKKFYEASYYLNIQNHKLSEINTRLNSILQRVISTCVPEEKRHSLQQEIEDMNIVTAIDIERRIKSNNQQQSNPLRPLVVQEVSGNATPTLVSPSQPNINNSTSPVPISIAGTIKSSMSKGSSSIQPPPTFPIKPIGSSSQTNIPKLTPLNTFQLEHSASSLCFNNKDSSHLFVGGKGCVKVFNCSDSTQREAKVIEFIPEAFVRTCRLSSDDSSLFLCGESKQLIVYDLISESTKAVLEVNGVETQLALTLSKDDKLVYSCLGDGGIGVWDLRTNDLVKRFEGHSLPATCIDLRGERLITGSLDKTTKVWDISSGKVLNEYKFDSKVFTLSSSPNFEQVIVGLENGSLDFINTKSQTQQTIFQHADAVLTTKYSKSGQYFISGGKDKTTNIFRFTGQKETSHKFSNSIISCDISSDNTRIAVGSWDNKAQVFTLQNLFNK